MESNTGLKDFWGNDAIDYGTKAEMTEKYADYIFVFVSNRPFGDGYVLFLCRDEEEELAYEWSRNYREIMKGRGVGAFGLGVSWGANVVDARQQGFLGGVRL